MGVGQPERIDVVFQRSSRQQNLRTGKIYTLHKQKLDKQFEVYTMHVISHHKYGEYTHYNYKLLTLLEACH